MRRFTSLLILTACLITSLSALAAPQPEIRVLVEDAGNVRIGAAGGGLRLLDPRGTSLIRGRAPQAIELTAGPTELLEGNRKMGEELLLESSHERLQIGNRLYRGHLKVLWQAPGKLLVINTIPLEDYLVGLIGSEISPAWPVEAIKAQAIAARTYALHHAQVLKRSASAKPYDVSSSVLSQVYDGAHKEDARSREAVFATRGKVLMRESKLFPAYYHSCCGGQTEHAHHVWPGESGPPVITDTFCERSPKHDWTLKIPAATFSATMRANNLALSTLRAVSIEPEEDSPRVANLIVTDDQGPHSIKATELRRIFGFKEIKSTWFTVHLEGNELLFTGRGYGHGVGMCQWGAKGMAEARKNVNEILRFYYPDAEVMTIY